MWPLSNDSRSKQFLRVLPGPDGRPESMVQRVWGQIQNVNLQEHSYIVTGKAQAEIIHHQLNHDIELILEPERRDTFAAILLAASYLYTHTNSTFDETVVIMPVDPYVDLEFFKTIRTLDSIVPQTDCQLVLVGVEPTYPSEKYGYILTERNTSSLRRVDRFVEKPRQEDAQELIEQGALWNCGVFAGRLDFFIQLLKDRHYPTCYEELEQIYSTVKKNSFDYEVVEKCRDIRVVPYSGYWKDLGTWNTLTEEMGGPISGKGISSQDSENTHIVNELDIPIAVLGVSNIVVAASPDGILITDKTASPRIKEVLNQEGLRPMYEERYWGWYKVLEMGKTDEGQELIVRSICIHEGRNISYHYHRERVEQWTVTSGKGLLLLEGQLREISSGDHIKIPAGTKHGIKAITDLRIVETQIGIALIEEDIIRVTMGWDEAVSGIAEPKA